MSLAINSTVLNGKYTILEKLDEGRYGHIFKIKDNEKTPFTYALKAISIMDMQINPTLKDNVNREIRIHKSLEHPNIVKFIEYGYTAKEDYKLIVLEYVDFGDMWDLLYTDTEKGLTEEEACDYFTQLINALMYLRDVGIIHRDLKPENILITKSGTIKLADFGWAIDRPSSHYVGTTKYCSPEMISSHEKYNYKTDVWSAGIILYEFLCGKVPFDSKKEKKIEHKILNNTLTFPEDTHELSDSVKDLIRFILNRNPHKRPDYEDILAHEWIINNSNDYSDISDIEFDEELHKEIENELEILRKSLVATTKNEPLRPDLESPRKMSFAPIEVIESATDWSD